MIVVFFLLLTAFFACSETALFSLSKFTISAYRYDRDLRKRMIAHLMSHPKDLLVTIMMLNILFNVLVQNTVSNIFKNSESWLLKVGVPLVLVLFFGEIIPKSIAISNNKKISYFVAPFISFFYRFFSFFRVFVTKITDFISRGLFFFIKKEKTISSEELYHIVENSEKTGEINIDEKEIIDGYLDLINANVKEKKIGKNEVIFYDINNPIDSLLDCFIEKKYSKVPVCNGNLDDVLGIITLEDFYKNKDIIENSEDIKKILLKAFFIPESTNAWDGLYQLKEKSQDLAVVVDEYGTATGIITKEDLIEIVFGDIEDVKETKAYTRSSKNVVIADGLLELSDFYDIFKKELISNIGQLTVGGWLIEKMDTIPVVGDKLTQDGFLFYILKATPNKIDKIYIRRIE